jgi:hypothetical protein
VDLHDDLVAAAKYTTPSKVKPEDMPQMPADSDLPAEAFEEASPFHQEEA